MGALVSRQLKMKPVVATVATVATVAASADPEPVSAGLQELKETIADLREQTIVLLETKAEALRDEAKAIDEVKQTLVAAEAVAEVVAEVVSKPEPAVVETVQVRSTGCCSAAIIITADAAPEPAPAPTPAPESTPDLISSQPSEPNDAPQTPPSSLEETTVIKPDTSVL